MTASRDGAAVVIGASMAGLAAARVLADRFGSVTVLDRDDLPTEAVGRRGVPQGRHAHGLLAAGQRRLEHLFPGLVDDLVAGGAQAMDAVADARWYQLGGYRVRCPSDLHGTFASRPFLEAIVRRRVIAVPGVSLRSGAAVAGLTATGEGRRVTGVRLADGEVLEADLVVDTSGRGGQSLRWRTALGYPEPPTSTVTIDVGYASRLLRRRPDDPVSGSYVVTVADPPVARMGVLFPIEGDRWIVTLGGFFGERAPTDDAGYLAFADRLPAPEVADTLRVAEPLTDVVTHRFPSSLRRHWERCRRHPAGYVALGDAVCSFNPIYGQGMTSAVLQAEALGLELDRRGAASDSLPRGFYRRAAKVVSAPWQIAAGADFAYPQTTGQKPPGTDAVNRYLARAIRATHVSPEVCIAMNEVQHLVASPPSLLRPALTARVLRTRSTPPLDPTLSRPGGELSRAAAR